MTITLTLTLPTTGNLDAAERLLIRAQNIYPDSTRIRLSYAEICELRGESKKVRDIFVKGNTTSLTLTLTLCQNDKY